MSISVIRAAIIGLTLGMPIGAGAQDGNFYNPWKGTTTQGVIREQNGDTSRSNDVSRTGREVDVLNQSGEVVGRGRLEESTGRVIDNETGRTLGRWRQ
jgi:hypothetical protein